MKDSVTGLNIDIISEFNSRLEAKGFNGCRCACHSNENVKHVIACCHPEDEPYTPLVHFRHHGSNHHWSGKKRNA